MTSPTAIRLPTNIRPVKYVLRLAPDLTAFTFKGDENVEIEVVESTSEIKINAAELGFSSAEVILLDGRTLVASKIATDEASETVAFSFDETLPQGSATLIIQFTGILNDQLRGFYRSQYTDGNGQIHFLATTQFEATDARRAFPCWDEPAIKATYEVTLVVPEGMVAISNTMVVSESSQSDGTKVVQFGESPKMSTYLLAFIVGNFASVEQRHPSGTLVRVWTTKGKEEQGRFALENAVNLLTYFNEYFGIPYPLDKLDHIAIPDFAAGAMENWGAITYRETALLYDANNSAAVTRQRVLEVVAHEMAHMWFGDLVTMEWWDDLWLNESFASWMGDKAVDHLYPDWQMWTQFVSHDTNSGLSLDGLKNSHPIEQEVKDPAEIRELFDAISYSKGGAILRMLENFLGAETFRSGLHDYLSSHRYANARTEDLWLALERVSEKPVTAVMNTWVKQTGYPLLEVEATRVSGQVNIDISQRRFLYDHLLDQEMSDPTLWQIPISLLSSSISEETSILMTEEKASLPTEIPDGDNSQGWVKLNSNQTGFYRVSYDNAEWERLRTAIQNLQLPSTDRLGLQNDAYALVRAGFADAPLFLSLAGSYKGEQDATVWSDLATNLRGMEALLYEEPYLDQFQAYGRDLFEDLVHRVGWDARTGEGHLDALLRSTGLGQAGSYGNTQVLEEAHARYERFLKEPTSLHPDLRGVVIALVAENGDRLIYDTLWDLERSATLQEEKMRFLGALTRFHQKEFLQETLERSMDPQEVRIQDTMLVITALAANRYGRDLAWEFLKNNWEELDRRYGRGGFAIMRLVAITGGFTTVEREKEVAQFFESHPAPSAGRTINQSLERIRLNVQWLERNSPALASWFSARN
jgi:puromycin-sensitive aminopeptidase